MPRNLDHRIEVVMPVEDTQVRNELESIFKALLADNSQAWELQSDGTLEARVAEEERAPALCTGRVHAPARSRAAHCPIALGARAVVWGRHHADVPVGVIDVGSNTVRLVVVQRRRELLSEREMLRLGADVELHGSIPHDKLAAAAAVVAFVRRRGARRGRGDLEVLITSPGRQAANGEELLDACSRAAAGCPTRILSATEEAQLAFVGALAVPPRPARRAVAVVDVGGGSAQVVVGTRRGGPEWLRSIDLGSQRLTSRHALGATRPGARRSAPPARRSSAISTDSIRPTVASRSPSAAAPARSSGSSAPRLGAR